MFYDDKSETPSTDVILRVKRHGKCTGETPIDIPEATQCNVLLRGRPVIGGRVELTRTLSLLYSFYRDTFISSPCMYKKEVPIDRFIAKTMIVSDLIFLMNIQSYFRIMALRKDFVKYRLKAQKLTQN